MSQPADPGNEILRQNGKVLTELHEDMPGIVQLLKDKQAETVLDLGCGSGTHTLYLAQHGFFVYALDDSQEGVELTRQRLADEGLQADLRLQSMTESLPYTDAFFDAAVSIQAIHRARIAAIKNIVGEIVRVLKEGGFVFVTVPMLGDHDATGEEIEPNTFVPLDGPDKGLPYHCFTPAELLEVFGSYEITDIHIDREGQYHCLSAFKP